jgi:hypothetical protein
MTRFVPPPAPEHVDIRAELTALRAILAHLDSPDHGKITQALDDAEGELAMPIFCNRIP